MQNAITAQNEEQKTIRLSLDLSPDEARLIGTAAATRLLTKKQFVIRAVEAYVRENSDGEGGLLVLRGGLLKKQE